MGGLERTWRRVVQVLAFAVFGLGGWLLAIVFFPVLWITPATAAQKTAFIQKTVHLFFRLFLWFLETFRGMEFSFRGSEALRQKGPGIVIANHPTLLDVVLLIAHMPQADCIVKRELWDHFFLKGVVALCGYISNDDGPDLVEEAIRRVRSGRKVIIFPEGTRSLPTGFQPFNKGFAHIAVKAPCPLYPVVMRCQPPALMKGHGLLEVPAIRARLEAVVQAPLNPADYYVTTDTVPVAVSKVAAAVRSYFEEKVNGVEPEHV